MSGERSRGRVAIALVFSVLMAMSAISMGAGMALADEDDLELDDAPANPDADAADAPWIEVEVTKDNHEIDEMGVDEEGVLTYLTSDGVYETLDADVVGNNTVAYYPAHMDLDRFSEITSDHDNATDADMWAATDGLVTDTELGQAEAVTFDTDGTAAVDATFDDFTVDSDEQIRNFAIAGAVDSIDADATISVNVVDEDGNTVTVSAYDGANVTDGDVFADSTANSFVLQQEIGDLEGGDQINNIEEINVVVTGGEAEVTISKLDLESYSAFTFGDYYDEEEEETETLTEGVGAFEVTELGTLDGALASAELDEITFDAEFHAHQLDADDRMYESVLAEGYPNFDVIGATTYRFQLVENHMLSYDDPVMKSEVALPDNLYEGVNYATNVGDGNLTDEVEEADWIASEEAYEGDEEVTIASGIATLSPGEEVAVQFEAMLSASQQEAITTVHVDDAGGGGIMGTSEGGILDTILSPIGGAIAAVLSFLGIKSRSSGD